MMHNIFIGTLYWITFTFWLLRCLQWSSILSNIIILNLSIIIDPLAISYLWIIYFKWFLRIICLLRTWSLQICYFPFVFSYGQLFSQLKPCEVMILMLIFVHFLFVLYLLLILLLTFHCLLISLNLINRIRPNNIDFRLWNLSYIA